MDENVFLVPLWLQGFCFSTLSFILRGQNRSVRLSSSGGTNMLWIKLSEWGSSASLWPKVYQALWQLFTSALWQSSLINRQSIFRLALMARGRGILCLDLSDGRDLKVVHRVLERELKYFSSLWHRMVVLQNKLRLNTEQATVQYQEIWQLWKLKF